MAWVLRKQQHEELGRHAVELFADFFADAREGLAASAVRGTEVVVAVNARQVGGQRLAHGFALAAGRCRWFGRRGLGGCVLSCGIDQDGIEQRGLRAAVQALGRAAEAPSLQAGDLSVARFVPGSLELDLDLHARDQISQHLHRIVGGRRLGCRGIRGFEHGQSICLDNDLAQSPSHLSPVPAPVCLAHAFFHGLSTCQPAADRTRTAPASARCCLCWCSPRQSAARRGFPPPPPLRPTLPTA